MHEIGIASSILEAVRKESARATRPARPTKVGRADRCHVAGVDPESLAFCFEALVKGTDFEPLELAIEPGAGRRIGILAHLELEDGRMTRVPMEGKVLNENDRVARRTCASDFSDTGFAAEPHQLAGIGQDRAAGTDAANLSTDAARGGADGRYSDRRRCHTPGAATGFRFARSRRRAPAIWMPAWCSERSKVGTSRTLDLLFIENVGNLVCPTSYDLGEAHKIVAAERHRRRGEAAEVSGHLLQSDAHGAD